METSVLQYVLYLAIPGLLAVPLGGYIERVMSGERTFLSGILRPCEAAVYKALRVDEKEEMSWKNYAVSVLVFSGIGLVFLILLQRLQGGALRKPAGASGGTVGAGLQYGGELRDEHKLAGLFRRINTELSHAGVGADGAELRLRRCRYRGFVRAHPWLHQDPKNGSRQLLG